MSGIAELDSTPRGGRWRILWIVAGMALLLPLIFNFPWTPVDYVFASILLFGSLGAYEVATRLSGDVAYRAGAAVAILGVFLLSWSNAAVGLTDGPADALFLLVPPGALVGAVLARFRPLGIARTMFATAFATAAIAVGAMVAGAVPDFNPWIEILGIATFFSMLFVGSGLLFRAAAE